MAAGKNLVWALIAAMALAAPAVGRATGPAEPATAGAPAERLAAVPEEVTFTKHIAPILQRSCQNCHRPDGVAPMSLLSYEEVRPWARSIKTRTGIGPRAGVMPPWYIEKNIGIQHYKDDPSLSEVEVATVAKWADTGAARGNPDDMPPPLAFEDDTVWRIGKPDLIVSSKELLVKGNAADWWGEIESIPIPIERGSLRRGGRDQGSQRRAQGRQRPRDGGRPLRVPPHDLDHAGAAGGGRARDSL